VGGCGVAEKDGRWAVSCLHNWLRDDTCILKQTSIPKKNSLSAQASIAVQILLPIVLVVTARIASLDSSSCCASALSSQAGLELTSALSLPPFELAVAPHIKPSSI
jgi:hypothetical protein